MEICVVTQETFNVFLNNNNNNLKHHKYHVDIQGVFKSLDMMI